MTICAIIQLNQIIFYSFVYLTYLNVKLYLQIQSLSEMTL